MTTDTQKCLDILRKAGAFGVHSFELNRAIGTTRAAARVDELKKLGHKITTKYEKLGDAYGVRYILDPSKPNTEASTKVQKKKVYVFDREKNVYIQSWA
jgi:hypothetical protein